MVQQNRTNGVVVVLNTMIHRPETGDNHGATAMRASEWVLFPSLRMAQEVGYETCGSCFGGWYFEGRFPR